MLTGQGKFQDNRLLSAKTVSEMFRNQLPEGVGEITRAPKGRGFGLGFAVRVRKIDSSPIGECEWLGGLGTEFFISPKDELAVHIDPRYRWGNGHIQRSEVGQSPLRGNCQKSFAKWF